jgi:DNA-binding LacI/PurR family transcriptional regulator
MVTLKHIAEKAGVTVSVVSRALNPRPDRHARVAPETKARIEETALALGFRRNRNAEFLKRGKSPVIQVFLPCKACSLMADLIYGIAESAEKEDFSLNFSYGNSEDSFSRFLSFAIQNRSCGLLAVQPLLSSDFWERTHPDAKSLKMVALNARQPIPDCYPALLVGLKEAGFMAAERLVNGGCTSLAAIGRDPLRIGGFQSAIQSKGIPFRAFLPADSESLAAWIHDQPKPVGLFAMTDILALKTISLLNQRGLNVPDDVRIIGHDDREFAAHIRPSLTTIRQQYREQGREGIRMVIRMMYDGAVQSKVIPPTLVVRKSA